MRWPWQPKNPDPAELVASVALPPYGPLTAAAAIGRIGAAANAGLQRRAQEWQGEAWDRVDTIGPLGSAVDYLANAVAKVRVFPAIVLDQNEAPVPLDSEDAQVPPSVVQSAMASWALYRDQEGGQSELLRAHARQFVVPGECFIVGREPSPNDPLGAESWQIRNVELVRQQGTGATTYVEVRDSPSSRWERLPEGSYVARMMQRHDRYPALADSPLRRLLPDCDEFIMESLAVAAATRSRVPAGIMKWPDGLSIVTPSGLVATNDPVRVLIEAMETAVADPGDAASLVPVFVKGTSDALKELGKLDLSRVTTTDHAGLRKDALQRIAQGGPWPPELFLGFGDTNRWNANVITNAVYDQYMDPLVIRMLAALAAAYLRPRLLADAQPPEWVGRICLWFDASSVTSNPAQVENAIKAYDRGLIKPATVRRSLDFSEDDAPDAVEYAAWLEAQRAQAGPPATRVSPLDPESTVTTAAVHRVLTDWQRADVERLSDRVTMSPRPAPAVAPTDTTPSYGTGVTAAGKPWTNAVLPAGPYRGGLTAAAAQDALALAKRLALIDAGLRQRITVAADAALRRAVDKAGTRVRSRVQRDRAASAAIKGVPNAQVAAVLGRAVVAAAADELELIEGAWEGLRDKYDTWTTTARRQALRAVAATMDDADFDDLDEESAEEFRASRDESWTWLAAALTGLALAALYDPDPAAPPEGEADPSVLVPQSVVREAVARAGGDQVIPDGEGLRAGGGERPAGGVATGQTVIDLFRAHGQVVAAWGWDYGDPSSRSRPFPPHEDLDGVLFASWTDDALINDGDYPDTSHFYIGDHPGCGCNVVAVFGPADSAGDESDGDDAGDLAASAALTSAR